MRRFMRRLLALAVCPRLIVMSLPGPILHFDATMLSTIR
jgi:hypothetical protein